MTREQLIDRFRDLLASDRAAGRVRSLETYQRVFHSHPDLIAEEYARLVGGATPPRKVTPPSSSGSILERLPHRTDPNLHRDGEIARGGMGAIEKVRDEALHRSLAMKVLLPGREDDPQYVHRFLEEAQVTAQLDHPGVVPVHQLGVDEDGRVFFTMKLVRGRTLSEIFELVRAREQDWSNTRAIELFIRICDTLAFAHQKGVIHRDLKPANIMVGDFGELYVMDWGLAKVLGDKAEPDAQETPEPRSFVRSVRSEDTPEGTDSPAATIAGDVLGTPAYMPLEQAMGGDLDARSDLYAVGAMLYELFAGHPPYGDKKRAPHQVLVATVAGPPTPLRTLAPKLPPEIIAICEKAMARDPADRYPSAAELAQELRHFIEGRVVRAYRTGAFVELRKWVLRNKPLAGALGAAIVLLIVGLVVTVRAGERLQKQAYRSAMAAAAGEIADNDLEAARTRLDAQPEHLRGWEWRHLRSRIDQSIAALPFRALVLDLAGDRVLGANAGGPLLAYDLSSGATTELLPAGALFAWHNASVRWISADGRYCLAKAGIFDLHAGRIVREGADRFDAVQPWLYAGERILELGTWREVPIDAAHRLALAWRQDHAHISPDRKRIAVAHDQSVSIVDVATERPVGEPIVGPDNVAGVAWSPDGTRLAVVFGRMIMLMDADTRAHRTLHGHIGPARKVVFSRDGKLLASWEEHRGRVWDAASLSEPTVLRGHHSYVYPVRFSPDGRRIASGGWDGYVKKPGALRIWDAATGIEIARTSRLDEVFSVAFLPGGRRLLAGGRVKQMIRVLDADTLQEVTRYKANPDFALSPDGTRLVTASGNKMVVLDAATGAAIAELGVVEGMLAGGGGHRFHYGEHRIAAITTHAVRKDWTEVTLWNAKTFAREATLPNEGAIYAIDFEPNGTRMVVGCDRGLAKVYDRETKELLATLPGHGMNVQSARFGPDGTRIFVGGRDGHIHVWDAESYREIVLLRGHTAYVYAMDFSPDGETLVSSSGDGTVRIWETKRLAVRQRAIAERKKLAEELKPRVDALFAELNDPNAVVARLRGDLKGRRLEVALQVALRASASR